MGRVVLDASALLALLFREPGMERVKAELPQSVMSAVNLSEVFTSVLRRGAKLPEATAMLAQLPIETIPFDSADASQAASLYQATKERGLSLGDRSCLALGLKLGIPVLTADREWVDLPINVQVEMIR